jgi:putative Holliday junction resolvase
LDGGSGMQSEKVKAFTQKLAEIINVPIDFRDESFTTASARQLMLQTKSKKARRNTRDDAIAAAFILQHYLDEAHPEYDADLE